VDTVGKNTAKVKEYIKHQLDVNKMGEQLAIPLKGAPFTSGR
jgi:putative transposase